MTAKEIVEAVSELVRILTQWPLVTLIIVIILRNQIANAIPALAERVRRISVGGNSIDFSAIDSQLQGVDPALRESVIGRLRLGAILEGESESLDEYEVSTEEGESSEDDVSEPDSGPDTDDFGRSLNELQGRGN